MCFFFFKQKPAYEMRISDWSSDVCSSDLVLGLDQQQAAQAVDGGEQLGDADGDDAAADAEPEPRHDRGQRSGKDDLPDDEPLRSDEGLADLDQASRQDRKSVV